MAKSTIQDWTASIVPLKGNDQKKVEYRVCRYDGGHFLEIRDANTGKPIHTFELPEGTRLDTSSYEVLLRYVLLDVVAA